MSVRSTENSVVSICGVSAVDSHLLIFKLTVEITIAMTPGPVKISAFGVAAASAFASEVPLDCGKLDVAINITLVLTSAFREAGLIGNVPDISVTIITPHPLIVSVQICFGLFPIIAAIIPEVSTVSLVAAAQTTIAVKLFMYSISTLSVALIFTFFD